MITLLLPILLACGGPKGPTAQLSVGPASITVELATNDAERARGLMHRDSLPEHRGMLFLYPSESIRSFWMRNTTIPLSIAYADSQGTIVRIADLTPLQEEGVSSLYPAKYALEVNRGWFDRNGVKKGDRIQGIPTDLTVE